jgi:iron complex outermembrane receptor protein
MLQMRVLLIYFLLVLSPLGTWAQFALSGQVLNAQQQPVVGASVLVHEIQRGRVTDAQGKFSFEGLKKGDYHLHIQFLGYEAQSVNVRLHQNEVLRLVLKASSLELREVLIENDFT